MKFIFNLMKKAFECLVLGVKGIFELVGILLLAGAFWNFLDRK